MSAIKDNSRYLYYMCEISIYYTPNKLLMDTAELILMTYPCSNCFELMHYTCRGIFRYSWSQKQLEAYRSHRQFK